MGYKPSLYNYIVKTENGDWLVYNFLNQNKLMINSEFVDQIKGYFDKNIIYEINTTDKQLKKLIEKKFIVSEDIDEYKIAQLKHNEVVYGTETLRVQLMPTNDCNLRCVYCFENPEPKYMNKDTEDKILRFLDRKLKKCKQFRFSWFGGEPLLCKDQVIRMSQEVHTLCKKNKVAMFGEISTNGYLLDKQTLHTLVSNGIHEYQICLDGTQEQHNKTRPHYKNDDSFQVILNNLIEISKVSFHNFSIALRCNITPQVEPYLDEYLQMLANYFKGDSRFHVVLQGVRNWGGNRVSDSLIPESENDLYLKWYIRAAELGLSSAENLSFAPFIGYCEANRKNGYVINYDGAIHKCNIAMFNPEFNKINQIGYIEESGREVLNEANMAQWLVHSERPRQECQECIMYPFCMGGHCFYKLHIRKEWACNKYLLNVVKSFLLSLYDKKLIDSFN